jgi:LysM repeat protein
MKTPAIFGIVVLAHCLAVGGIIVIQGCDTTRGDAPRPIIEETVIMPPASIEPTEVKPVIKPVVREWPKETTEYSVRPGDSISKIASRFGVTTASIVSLNGIANKNVIRVGQRLMIPGKVDVNRSPRKTVSRKPSASKPVKVSGGTYVVKPGDCLGVIAASHGVKVDTIRKANGISGDKIMVGQKLVIPGVKVKPVAKKAQPAPVVKAEPKPAAPPAPKAAEPKAAEPAVAKVTPPAKPEAAPAPAEPRKAVITETHVVQKGEDLRRISMQWLVSEEKIRDYNNITGDELQPGKVLLIPLSE